MASVSLFVFFLVSYLGLLLSAGQEESYTQNCRPLSCGDLERIGFPFINIRHPDPKCGVGIVNCSEENKTIQLVIGERQYELRSIKNVPQRNAYIVVIRGQTLSGNLSSDGCEFLKNSTIPPQSPNEIISFEIISAHKTLVKCNHAAQDFGPKEFKCGDGYNYYRYDGHPSDRIRSGCSIIQLPMEPWSSDPPIITAEFELQVKVSDADCSHCDEKEGQCQINRNIYCPKKGNSKVLAIALDLEGGGVYFGVHIFPYSELQEATNNFDDEKELGDGGFGTVYYGKLRDGREVAVKRLYEHNCRQVQQFINEVDILMRMRHKNLVSLYGCTSRRSRELLLVYEYIPNGTVADHIHGDRAAPGSLSWPTRMGIAIETASALAFLHASDIIHRDVKTNNILLDNNFCVKVADFGLSRLFPNDVTHVSTGPQGTPGYVDPEYHQCYQLTKKSDVYSFGVVLIELISSLPAVDITRHRHEINLADLAVNKIEQRALHELIDPHLGFQSDGEVKRMTISVASLAFQCIQGGQELRPSMVEVLEALKGIQSGKDIGPLNVHPPTSPDCDDVVLSEKIHELPPSPNAVTDNWTSTRSSTPNISG
ncbi:hypothetical protein I3760_06G017100 [Carya illinoinensis]|nr:hypothetical protein I3760_06G017100 [Carya illinoinensis]